MDFGIRWNYESLLRGSNGKLIMRVLRRPMFRGGSSGEGITSGLAPRQGYADPAGQVNQLDDLAGLTIPQIREVAQGMAYRPRGRTPADALIEFGLNLASAPPSGSIFSTAAGAAKEPFQRYAKSKAESEAARYVSEADMFKTLIGAQAKLKSAAKEGKGWLEQWKFEQIPILNEKIDRLTKLNPKPGTEEFRELKNAKEQKARIVQLDPLTKGWAEGDQGAMAVQQEALRLIREDNQKAADDESYQRKYPEGTKSSDIAVVMDAIENVRRQLSGLNEGGRVGYQQGMSVDKLSELNKATVTPFQESPQMEQAETMPEELTGVTYDELRRRLPTEVSDEIVRLLVSSAEAMEDFAMIQTAEDVANFNQKYSVELALPSEV